MPAKDTYHDSFCHALEKDGWIITRDPLTIPYGKTEVLVDIGAERLVAAERDGKRIAVEIKSFVKASLIQDLKEAIGQFVLYADAIADFPEESDRMLYLAIREETYNDLFRDQPGQRLIERGRVRLVVFNPFTEVISQWTS